MNPRLRRNRFGKFAQHGRILALVQEAVPAKEHVKLQIIIGQASANNFEHPAFTSPITASKDQPFQEPPWDATAHTIRNAFARSSEVRFQAVAPIKRESFHFR
jgi:hypothetical protein